MGDTTIEQSMPIKGGPIAYKNPPVLPTPCNIIIYLKVKIASVLIRFKHSKDDIMRILLIGGSGFVGKNLYASLQDKHTFYIMSRHKPSWLEDTEKWIEGDIINPASVRAILNRDFDVVVDLVGLINQKEQYHYDVNVFGTKNISDALLTKKETKFVYISTINSDKGKTEYFKTKREAEKNVMLHANYLIIRPSILYGKDDYLTLQLLSTAKRFLPVFPKSDVLCPLYIGDFAIVFDALLDKTGSFDVCSREMLHLGDMLNIIRKKMGKKPVPEVSLSFFKVMSPVLSNLGIISSEQIAMLKYGFYREDTELYKYQQNPMQYEKFIDDMIKK